MAGSKRSAACSLRRVLVYALVLAISMICIAAKHSYAASLSDNKADVVFVIDSTGSMSGSIDDVKQHVGSFAENLESHGIDVRLSIVEFRDITVDGNDSTIVHRTKSYSPWFTSVSDFRSKLDSISVDGGGDTPETLIDALGYVARGDISFRSDAHKFVFAVTDAGYKSSNTFGYVSMASVVKELSSKGIVISVVTDPAYFDDSWSGSDESIFDAMSEKSESEDDDSETAGKDNPGKDKPVQEPKYGSNNDVLYTQSTMEPLYTLTAGNSVNVTLGIDGTAYVSFVPHKSGVYAFESTSDEYDTIGELLNSSGGFLYSNDDDGSSYNFRIVAKLRGGVQYNYKVRLYSGGGEGTVIPVSLKLIEGLDESGAEGNISYREIANRTNGVLIDIYSDFSAAMDMLAANVLAFSQNGSKKAIYILPGYMGSQLYSKSTEENIWVNVDYLIDDVTKYTLPGGDTSILMRDSEGGSGNVKAMMSKDKYGSQDTYKTLINRLEDEVSDEYDVIFFPYDWLGDLSEEAARLENHVRGNGYDKIVLITHSTGGLLASNFIARSNQNKRVVSKAILVAPPLYGTYSALQPIETGKTATSDDMLKNNGVSGLKLTLAHGWVKGVTKNSPTTYQLFPSEEYLKSTAIVYSADTAGTAVTSKSTYYDVLNGSGNINPTLTNGNSRSHDYFRSTILNGDIVKVLKGVDTVVVGSSSGNSTPAIAVYKEKLLGGTKLDDMIYKNDGDGTVLGLSAFALKDGSTHVLKYRDFKNVSHGDLVSKNDPVTYICNQVPQGDKLTTDSDGTEDELVTQSDDGDASGSGMDQMIKFIVQSNEEVVLRVTDSEGSIVDLDSSADKRFTYLPLSADKENKDYRLELYVPAQGWKVEVCSVSKQDAYEQASELASQYGMSAEDLGFEVPEESYDVHVEVELSTLDEEGFRTATASYIKDATVASDAVEVIANFDLSDGVDASNIGNFESSMSATVSQNLTDWSIPLSLVIDQVGDVADLGLSGSDVDSGSISYENLTLSTSDENVVTVDEYGQVLANGYGSASITAYSNLSDKVCSCIVTVPYLAQSIVVEDIDLAVDERVVPSATFDADYVTSPELTLESSDEGIVAVDGDVLVGMRPGQATITASVEGGATTTFKANVTDDTVFSVTSVAASTENAIVAIGETADILASISPVNATNKGITWHVEDEGILSIVSEENDKCTIEALAAGTSDVYAVTDDGGYSAHVRISVPFFTDANPLDADNHGAEVNWMGAYRISEGWEQSDGSHVFRGLENVKRCDFAAFLYRLADLNDDGWRNDSIALDDYEIQSTLAGVSDCDETTPHAADIAWMINVGISRGWQDEGRDTVSFRPMSSVARQDMAAFLYRFADLQDNYSQDRSLSMGPETVTFSDVVHGDEANHATEVEWLASVGVTKGWAMGDGTYQFRGLWNIARQDMAAFMYRLYNYMN